MTWRRRAITACAAIRLPAGATEQEVLQELGRPQSRRPMGASGEVWGYDRYLDDEHNTLASSSLRFDGHRLVDARTYVFK